MYTVHPSRLVTIPQWKLTHVPPKEREEKYSPPAQAPWSLMWLAQTPAPRLGPNCLCAPTSPAAWHSPPLFTPKLLLSQVPATFDPCWPPWETWLSRVCLNHRKVCHTVSFHSVFFPPWQWLEWTGFHVVSQQCLTCQVHPGLLTSSASFLVTLEAASSWPRRGWAPQWLSGCSH